MRAELWRSNERCSKGEQSRDLLGHSPKVSPKMPKVRSKHSWVSRQSACSLEMLQGDHQACSPFRCLSLVSHLDKFSGDAVHSVVPFLVHWYVMTIHLRVFVVRALLHSSTHLRCSPLRRVFNLWLIPLLRGRKPR